MERMLSRKPLYPAEKQATPAMVCVTGGIGYIGSSIVARLLAAGHTVRAVWRACEAERPSTRAIHDALCALPGAAERLHWLTADLLVEGSYDDAIKGCKYVIHTACPVLPKVPKKHAYERMIRPALIGTQNVLRSVNKSGTVEKVVMTSSLKAAYGDKPAGSTYTEDDYNVCALQQGPPYDLAKTLSEWQAWSIAGQQDRWQLVTLCPGFVFGPSVVPMPEAGGTVVFLKETVDGTSWPFQTTMAMATMDVDDVAAAHVLAMSLPTAQGRYLLSEQGLDLQDLTAMLRKMYPGFWIPKISLPAWLVRLMLDLKGEGSSSMIHPLECDFDCSKARSQLGLDSLIPLEKSLREAVDQMIDQGTVPAPSVPGGSGKGKTV